MAALKSGEKNDNNFITGAVCCEIVSALATLIMVQRSYPTPEQYTAVCQKLVEELNILQDGFRCGYVSHYFNQHSTQSNRKLVAMDALGELESSGVLALGFTARAIKQVRSILQCPQHACAHAYFSPLVHDGAVGRPRYDVPMSTLESLVAVDSLDCRAQRYCCLLVRMVCRQMCMLVAVDALGTCM